jgi:hypothetical protein
LRLVKLKFKGCNCKKILVALTLLVLLFSEGYTQFFSTGQDPFSTSWEQINTRHFRIIYPKEFYKESNRLANLLDYSYEPITKSLDRKPGKVPVILHNSSALSNGYVSWAPKRMEFITTTPPDSYGEDWLEQLALHEFRHIAQVDKLNQGFTRILSWTFGQQATGAMVGYLPLWFVEGDAVVTETALSSTGRGRLPSFEMKLKALYTENGSKISYDKMYFGSFKDFIPDYYPSGYLMVAYARLKYDPYFSSTILDNVARKPYLLCPFYLGMKKNYNLSKVKLYRETFDTLKYLWTKQINNVNYTDYSYISGEKSKFYTSYRYPQYVNDSTVVVLKSSIDHLTQFVLVSRNGTENRIHTPGYMSTDRLSSQDSKIVWDEIVEDPRWEHRSYSVIKIMDTGTGKKKRLTRKTRYFSPSISNDGEKIVVIEIDKQNINYLTIINAHSGTVIKRIPSEADNQLQYPAWTDKNDIIAVSVDGEGKKIKRYDLAGQVWSTVYSSKNIDISQPVVWKNYILFRGGFNGIDNIYAVNVSSGNIFQVTSSRYGAYDPSVINKSDELLYADYTSNGYKSVLAPLDTDKWIPLSDVTDISVKWYNPLAQLEDKNIQESDIPSVIFKPEYYSRLTHLFNLHSWYPFYVNLDYENIDLSDLPLSLGLTILSQNELSTAVSSIGYSYEKGYHYLYPKFTYYGFYPVLEFSAILGGPSTYLKLYENIDAPKNVSYEKSYLVKSYLPLRFSNGKYVKIVIPRAEYEFNTLYYFDGGYKKGISSLHYKLGLYRYLRPSHRDIDYKWGQAVYFTYTHSPSNKLFGSLFSVSSKLYFPGLFPHHSFRIYGGMQKQYPKMFIYYINRVLLPRGYPNYYSEKSWKLTLDYSFPLAYPEISLGPVVYVKRIKMNLFLDHAYGYNVRHNAESAEDLYTGWYNSLGIELTSDLNVLRFIFPFNAGIRCSYLPLKSSFSAEFLLSVNTSLL